MENIKKLNLIEQNLIINIQDTFSGKKESSFIDKIMSLISLPFHMKIFWIIVFYLYLNNYIDKYQVFFLIASPVIVGILKYIFRRNRPFQSNLNIKNLEKQELDYYSFPSGHSFTAFSLFFLLSKNNIIKDSESGLWLIPTSVAFSRVYMGVHYPSDVLTGALLAKFLVYYLF